MAQDLTALGGELADVPAVTYRAAVTFGVALPDLGVARRSRQPTPRSTPRATRLLTADAAREFAAIAAAEITGELLPVVTALYDLARSSDLCGRPMRSAPRALL